MSDDAKQQDQAAEAEASNKNPTRPGRPATVKRSSKKAVSKKKTSKPKSHNKPYTVAYRRSVTSKRGVLTAHSGCGPEDFRGGDGTCKRLVKRGVLVPSENNKKAE